MFLHLSPFIGWVIPLGNFLGPLIMWQMRKDSDFICDAGKGALNFQITAFLAAIVSTILIFVVIGFFLLIVVAVAFIVFVILAAIAVNKGERYRFPYCLRLIK